MKGASEDVIENAPWLKLTYKTIGLAMEVHNEVGPGHREVVYHNALAAKLRIAGFDCEDEPTIHITLEDGTIVGGNRPDLVVEDSVIFELKARFHQMTRAIDLYRSQRRSSPTPSRRSTCMIRLGPTLEIGGLVCERLSPLDFVTILGRDGWYSLCVDDKAICMDSRVEPSDPTFRPRYVIIRDLENVGMSLDQIVGDLSRAGRLFSLKGSSDLPI